MISQHNKYNKVQGYAINVKLQHIAKRFPSRCVFVVPLTQKCLYWNQCPCYHVSLDIWENAFVKPLYYITTSRNPWKSRETWTGYIFISKATINKVCCFKHFYYVKYRYAIALEFKNIVCCSSKVQQQITFINMVPKFMQMFVAGVRVVRLSCKGSLLEFIKRLK